MSTLVQKVEDGLKQAGLYSLAGIILLIAAQMGMLLLAVGIAIGLSDWLGEGWAFAIMGILLLIPIVGAMIWLRASQHGDSDKRKRRVRRDDRQEISDLVPGVPPAVDEMIRRYPLPVIAAGIAGGYVIGRQPQLIAAIVRAVSQTRR